MPTGREHHQVIGLVGIGLLGSALADRLIQAGFDVWGHDVSSQAMDEFTQQAMTILTSGRLAEAMDLEKEDPRVLAKYTPDIHLTKCGYR